MSGPIFCENKYSVLRRVLEDRRNNVVHESAALAIIVHYILSFLFQVAQQGNLAFKEFVAI